MKIALANLPFTGKVNAAVSSLDTALREAASAGAEILCTPEIYLPELKGVGFDVEPTSAAMIDEAHRAIGQFVKQSGVALVLGSEVPSPSGPPISALARSSPRSKRAPARSSCSRRKVRARKC